MEESGVIGVEVVTDGIADCCRKLRANRRARELATSATRQLESLGTGEAPTALAALTTYVVSRKL